MATEKKKESKQKYGDYNKDGKVDSIGAMLRDITDGGGRGGSGASYSNLNNSDYRRAGGKPYQEGTERTGWTSFDPQGKGRTEAQSPFMRNVAPSLFGLLTGGVSGAAMGMMGGALRNKVKDQGGLLNALGVGQNQASQQPVGLGSSPRPQIRPANLALPQVSSAYQSYLGPFDPRVSTGQVDFGTNAFGPLSSIGLNSQALNGYNPTGDLTPAGAMTGPINPPRANAAIAQAGPIIPAEKPTIPSGMSELRYRDYLRSMGMDFTGVPESAIRNSYSEYLQGR